MTRVILSQAEQWPFRCAAPTPPGPTATLPTPPGPTATPPGPTATPPAPTATPPGPPAPPTAPAAPGPGKPFSPNFPGGEVTNPATPQSPMGPKIPTGADSYTHGGWGLSPADMAVNDQLKGQGRAPTSDLYGNGAPGGSGGGGGGGQGSSSSSPGGLPDTPGSNPRGTPGGPPPGSPGKPDADGILPNARPLYDSLKKNFPGSTIGGYRVDDFHEHDHGALDFMTNDPNQAHQVMQQAFSAGAPYVLYQQKQWNSDGSTSPMEDRHNPTANHFDHVHIAPFTPRQSSRIASWADLLHQEAL